MGKVVRPNRSKCGKIGFNGKASDDSDEDYVVEEGEDFVDEDEVEKLLYNDDEDENDEEDEDAAAQAL